MNVGDRILICVDAELADLATIYLANRRKDLEAIAAALDRRDYDAIHLIAHNMRGSGRMYGFDDLTLMGAELQRVAITADHPGIAEVQHRLADYLSRVEIGLTKRHDAEPGGNLAADAAQAGSSDPGRANARSRILLVDDQEMNRLLIGRYLRREGYVVTCVPSGEKALEALERKPQPAVVLLDVVMPGMDGFEACRRIKSNPRTMVIPVVLVTGLDGREDRVRGIEAGADDFLSKPVCREELVTRVRSVVNLNRLHGAQEEQQLL